MQSSRTITLNLFDDLTLIALLGRVELPASGGYAWIGTLQGIDLTQAIFVVVDGIISTNIRWPRGNYRIRTSGSGLYEVRQINETAFVALQQDYVEAPAGIPQKLQGALVDHGSVIDVLGPYTADGGRAGRRPRCHCYLL